MENNAKMEACVLCNKETNVPVSQHVAQRSFYVEGCGQLCCECYAKVFGKHMSNSNN